MEEGKPGCCHVYRDGRKHGRDLVKVIMEIDPDPTVPGAYRWRCWLCRVWKRLPTKQAAYAFTRRHVRENPIHTRQWRQIDEWHYEN